MKLLITGASGLYGSKLAETATARNHKVYAGYTHNPPAHGTPIKLDITDKTQVYKAIEKAKPDAIVHAAALTDVDKCETNKQLAWKTNVEGTKNIAEAANTQHAFLLYISTDYVFNGEKGQYTETDTPNPINHYGLTKLKAEELVKTAVNTYCIARTSVLYGATPAAGKTNFALWLLNRLEKNEPAKIVTDQWNTPTLNTNLADMTLEILERTLTGTFHLAGATRINRYDFAKQLAQAFKLDTNLITPCTTADFAWPAKRPTDSSLNTTKAQQTLRNKPLSLKHAIEKLKHELNTLNTHSFKPPKTQL